MRKGEDMVGSVQDQKESRRNLYSLSSCPEVWGFDPINFPRDRGLCGEPRILGICAVQLPIVHTGELQ
jgi:hypothetical protein